MPSQLRGPRSGALFEGTRSDPQKAATDPQGKACWREPQWSPTLDENAVGCLAATRAPAGPFPWRSGPTRPAAAGGPKSSVLFRGNGSYLGGNE